jgi:hypothetical protein
MTQVSAELFCAYMVNQPRSRMPKDMLVRFIARANNEGIPLNSPAESAGFSGPALTAAFVLGLLLVSVTLHFSFRTRTAIGTVRANTASISASMSDKGEASQGSQTKIAPGDAHSSITASRQNAHGNGRAIPLLFSRANGHRRVFRVDSGGLEQSQFDLTVYPQTLAIFHLPFIVTAKLDQTVQWAPARYGTPRFPFVEPSEFAKDDPLRLLAGYEHRAFAPWSIQDNLAFDPGDVQVFRRDFDPNAYRTLVNPDFKRNHRTDSGSQGTQDR